VNGLLQIFDPANIGAFFTQFNNEMQQPAFWFAVGKIIWINVLLSGDNALVIALACRGLQPKQRLWGMILGAAAAVILRIIFTGIVATLMGLPYLKLVGGLALIVIAALCNPHLEQIRIVEHRSARSIAAAGVSIDPHLIEIDPRILRREVLHSRNLIRQRVVPQVGVIRLMERLRPPRRPHAVDTHNDETKLRQ